jgi:hypothetical protein
VTAFAETSTMRAAPAGSTWVSCAGSVTLASLSFRHGCNGVTGTGTRRRAQGVAGPAALPSLSIARRRRLRVSGHHPCRELGTRFLPVDPRPFPTRFTDRPDRRPPRWAVTRDAIGGTMSVIDSATPRKRSSPPENCPVASRSGRQGATCGVHLAPVAPCRRRRRRQRVGADGVTGRMGRTGTEAVASTTRGARGPLHEPASGPSAAANCTVVSDAPTPPPVHYLALTGSRWKHSTEFPPGSTKSRRRARFSSIAHSHIYPSIIGRTALRLSASRNTAAQGPRAIPGRDSDVGTRVELRIVAGA